MRILITGVCGFAGSHLADHLLARSDSIELWGVAKEQGRPAYLDPRVHLFVADLRDSNAVEDVLRRAKPDQIYHLAGQAYVPQSWENPWQTLETNIRSQLNLLEACLRLGALHTRVLAVGSEEEYGALDSSELPAREDLPLQPGSPYGISKVAQDLLGRAFFLRHGIPAVRVRPFNHIGPRQDRRFVASDFASQIVAIERGLAPPIIRVGNLDAERDFTDVRDVVRGYVAALEDGVPGDVYNICSGQARSIRHLLEGLLAHAFCEIAVQQDPSDRKSVV